MFLGPWDGVHSCNLCRSCSAVPVLIAVDLPVLCRACVRGMAWAWQVQGLRLVWFGTKLGTRTSRPIILTCNVRQIKSAIRRRCAPQVGDVAQLKRDEGTPKSKGGTLERKFSETGAARKTSRLPFTCDPSTRLDGPIYSHVAQEPIVMR